MAKEDLKPIRSKEEAIERGRKGGIRSGEVRRAKKTLKEELLLLLEMCVDGTKKTNQEMISIALMLKAQSGDVKAYEVIRDTIGEKPVDEVKLDGGLQFNQGGLLETLEELKKK